MTQRRRYPFTEQLRAMRVEGNYVFLMPEYRDWLTQLADYPGIENVWTRIEKVCGSKDLLTMRSFIGSVLQAKWFAEAANQWPDYAQAAGHARKVLDFLKPSQRFPLPLPMPGLAELQVLLARAIQRMEEFAKNGRIHVSRKSVDDSRKTSVFMQFVSKSMKDEYFKHWFDNEVAELTNALFPDAIVSSDAVRAARRAKRRKSNSVPLAA